MGKPRPPEGFPAEVEFCKRSFAFHKTEDDLHYYKLDHVLIIIREYGSYCEAEVCATSRDHKNRSLAEGKGDNVKQAVKRAEKDFQAVYYKIKPLMEK